MLSYRHGFHAGNFADVFKHAVLSLMAQTLIKKEKPLFYLDTHAGAGSYDLGSAMAAKNREHAGGIGRIWSVDDLPVELEGFRDAVRAANPGTKLRNYPGSPRIMSHFLRTGDRMVLCELHSSEISRLKAEFQGNRQVRVEQTDGYQALKAVLPPKERRGLVLCDPAYELKEERQRVVEGMTAAWQRWPTGHYAIWYPILDRPQLDWFHRQFKRSGIGKILVTELRLFPEDLPKRLNGSGMLLINPPWPLETQLSAVGPWLWRTLSRDGEGDFRQFWLVPE